MMPMMQPSGQREIRHGGQWEDFWKVVWQAVGIALALTGVLTSLVELLKRLLTTPADLALLLAGLLALAVVIVVVRLQDALNVGLRVGLLLIAALVILWLYSQALPVLAETLIRSTFGETALTCLLLGVIVGGSIAIISWYIELTVPTNGDPRFQIARMNLKAQIDQKDAEIAYLTDELAAEQKRKPKPEIIVEYVPVIDGAPANRLGRKKIVQAPESATGPRTFKDFVMYAYAHPETNRDEWVRLLGDPTTEGPSKGRMRFEVWRELLIANKLWNDSLHQVNGTLADACRLLNIPLP